MTVFKSFYADVWNSGLSEHPRLGRAGGRTAWTRTGDTDTTLCVSEERTDYRVWSGVAVANERDGRRKGSGKHDEGS